MFVCVSVWACVCVCACVCVRRERAVAVAELANIFCLIHKPNYSWILHFGECWLSHLSVLPEYSTNTNRPTKSWCISPFRVGMCVCVFVCELYVYIRYYTRNVCLYNILCKCVCVCVCTVPVEVGAAPDGVVSKVFLCFLIAKVLQRVGPQEVTHGPERRRLFEPVQLGHTGKEENQNHTYTLRESRLHRQLQPHRGEAVSHRGGNYHGNRHSSERCLCGSVCVWVGIVSTFFMSSSVCISGESPPWTHRNCWFIRAARGKQSNASIQESYTCSEYLILPGGRPRQRVRGLIQQENRRKKGVRERGGHRQRETKKDQKRSKER